MNDEFDELIEELGRLRPSRPGQSLKQRIADNLDGRARVVSLRCGRVWSGWYKWVSLAGAAAVVVLAAVTVVRQPNVAGLFGGVLTDVRDIKSEGGAGASSEPDFDLVWNVNYLIGAEDGGFVDAPAPVPLRKVTWQYVSTAEFRDRRDNAIVQVFIPREETVLIPAAVY